MTSSLASGINRKVIAFSLLGNYGRLGNQLFQYAFLRETAGRLGTQFYCPHWDGDDQLVLRDEALRAPSAEGLTRHFGPSKQSGYDLGALEIQDNTEIEGFFQSERYYSDPDAVRGWFEFRPHLVEEVHAKMPGVPWSESVSFSLRLDDDYNNTREYFPLYPREYYERALAHVKAPGPIVVFADRPDRAKKFLAESSITKETLFVEGLGPWAQLYAMTLCRDNVITNSTFAWWGAWLNPRKDKVVVAADSWCRPGVPQPIDDILCASWTLVPGTHPVFDHFQAWRVRHPVSTVKRLLRRFQSA